MKKIVALVLSLVMVLGLATTAFAVVSNTTTVDGEGYGVYATVNDVASFEDVDFTKVVTGESTETKDGKVTTTYTATVYTFANGWKAIEVAPSFATHKLVDDNGAIVAYLMAGTSATTTKAVDSVVAAVEEPACGEYAQNAAAKQFVVYVVGEKAYYGDSNINGYAVLNGQFVGLGTPATPVAHKYVAATFSTTKHTDVATVKCSECDETWKVLSAADVATMAPAAYKKVAVKVTATENQNLYIALDAPVVDAPVAGDKVESAETFDAGIAMYVGMSVMAAAGSAVVLKKKD